MRSRWILVALLIASFQFLVCGTNQGLSQSLRQTRIGRKVTPPVYVNLPDLLQTPQAKITPLKHSPFGLHAAQGLAALKPGLKTPFVRQIVRWENVEPSRGDYQFPGADRTVKRMQNAGLDMVITVRPVSRWGVNLDYQALVKEQPAQNWHLWSGPPRDLSAWLAFVRTFVERYDDDGIDDMPGLKRPIRYWQIDNEILWQWKGEMSDYSLFFAATARAIRLADPKAKVILGAIDQSSGLALGDGIEEIDHIWFGQENPRKMNRFQVRNHARFKNHKKKADEVLRNAGPHCDIIDFHDYGEDANDMIAIVKWLRRETNRFGYNKPIWSLENAGPFFHYSEKRHSEELVKRHVVGIAAGVECLFWSSLHPTTDWSQNFQRLSLLDVNTRKKPVYPTYELMARKLQDVQAVRPALNQNGLVVYEAILPDSSTFIAWSNNVSNKAVIDFGQESGDYVITNLLSSRSSGPPAVKRISVQGGTVEVTVSSPMMIEGVR